MPLTLWPPPSGPACASARRSRTCSFLWPWFWEFLTHETTCASEMLEKTTCEKFCQKRPPMSGGTPGQATRGTCRLGQCRQASAAVAVAGTSVSVRRRLAALAHVGPAAIPGSGMMTWHSCRLTRRRHVAILCTDSRTSMQKRPALTSMQKERS
jgi:hypothetical protein